MSNRNIRTLLIFGALLVVGIITIQAYSTFSNWQLKDIEFNQDVHIALRKVAEKIANYNKSKLPKQNLIQRRASNYYAVNINDDIDANILEDFLIREFEAQSLNTDFEYAVYDCSSDNMVYGNYCDIGENDRPEVIAGNLPKFSGLDYYFVVKFPSRKAFIVRSIWQSILFSGITILALGFFIYASIIILKQKKLSEMQKDFINNMTHEFKTPISSMKIAADVLSNDTRVKEDPRLSNYVEIIRNQNVRLNEQVEKVLDIARIEKDALKLKPEDINLSAYLEEIVNSFIPKLGELNGILQLNLPEKDVFLNADKLHLGNVLYNLIDNATKYVRENPKIEVNLTEKKCPILEVKDNGIGIEEQYLSNLFDKFYRVPTGNLHNVKGFGLGLYYVKKICDAHQWRINVSSVKDEGTTFIIKFDN